MFLILLEQQTIERVKDFFKRSEVSQELEINVKVFWSRGKMKESLRKTQRNLLL